MLDAVGNPVVSVLLIGLALGLSTLALWWLGVSVRPVHDHLRDRWLFGVPWGSLVVVGLLFGVYLFVQRGWWHWHSPVVVAYTAVSLFDPTGWLFAGFAHASPGHLRGNVVTTIVFAPIVEWIWGHKRTGERPDWEPSWAAIPWIRAIVLFPLGIGLITITAALFSWGPLIGFSVAAYALVGISLVHYPLLTVIGLVAREGVRLLWQTWTDPVVVTITTIRAVRPGWYGTAVQGHLVGLLLGVLVALLLLQYHDRRPSAGRVWLASVFVGSYLSLWAIWWILGPDQFVLFRAAGLALVLGVATLIAVSVSVPEHEIYRWDVNLRTPAIAILIVGVLGMGVVGIGLNLATAEPPDRPVATSVGEYDIHYGVDVPDGMVNVVDVEIAGLTTDVRTSGVIVYSERRNVWRQPVSTLDLQARGVQRFHVGGLGWSEEVIAVRRGWIPTGNESVYQVWIGTEGEFQHAYASDPQEAQLVIENRSFEIEGEDGAFYVTVEHEEQIERVQIPTEDETVTANGIQITREENKVIAATDGTAVTIATQEPYRELPT